MSLSLDTSPPKAPIIVIYGPEGLGKSTFGFNMPNPVFVPTERVLQEPRFPVAKTFEEFKGYLFELGQKEHDRQTIVIDSLDWLETLIIAETIKRNPTTEKGRKVENIDDYGFGKGYVLAMDVWNEYFNTIMRLQAKGFLIVQTAHASIKKFQDPLNESYDRYSLKIQDRAASKVMEFADVVLFLNSYVTTTKKKEGFGSERVVGVGTGERILHTERQAAFNAKNRYDLPSEIIYDKEGNYMDILKQYIPTLPTKKESE